MTGIAWLSIPLSLAQLMNSCCPVLCMIPCSIWAAGSTHLRQAGCTWKHSYVRKSLPKHESLISFSIFAKVLGQDSIHERRHMHEQPTILHMLHLQQIYGAMNVLQFQGPLQSTLCPALSSQPTSGNWKIRRKLSHSRPSHLLHRGT